MMFYLGNRISVFTNKMNSFLKNKPVSDSFLSFKTYQDLSKELNTENKKEFDGLLILRRRFVYYNLIIVLLLILIFTLAPNNFIFKPIFK